MDEFRSTVGEISPIYKIDLHAIYWQKLRPTVYDRERLAHSLLRPQFSLKALSRYLYSYVDFGVGLLRSM